jgi:hypothetical protein
VASASGPRAFHVEKRAWRRGCAGNRTAHFHKCYQRSRTLLGGRGAHACCIISLLNKTAVDACKAWANVPSNICSCMRLSLVPWVCLHFQYTCGSFICSTCMHVCVSIHFEFRMMMCAPLSACPHVRMSACPHVRTSACLHVCMSAYPYVRMSACPHVRMSACLHVRMSVCPHPHVRMSASCPWHIYVCMNVIHAGLACVHGWMPM